MDIFVIAYELDGERFEVAVNFRYFKKAYFKDNLLLVMEFSDFTILHQAKKSFTLSYLFHYLSSARIGSRIALSSLELD